MERQGLSSLPQVRLIGSVAPIRTTTGRIGILPGSRASAALLLSCFGWLAVYSAAAQPFKGGSGSNYVSRLYYPAPNYRQVKYELSGLEVVSLTNGAPGRIALTQLRIAQFSVKGERELLIEAPSCVYDDNTREASSSGRLQIEYGKDQLRLSGEGFLWQHRVQSLVISNDVNATVRLQTNAAAPLQITSRWFVFDVTNRHAVFHENVHGVDAERDFTCDSLGVRGGTNSRTMDVIEADGNVALTHTGSPATFYAFVVLYRNQRHGFVVLFNADSPEIDGAIMDILTAMAPSVSGAVTREALALARKPGRGR